MRRSLVTYLCLLLASCGAPDETISLRFVATIDGEEAQCGHSALSDLRFFVSDVSLITSSGSEVQARLVDSPPWQNGSVAQVDLEDGSGSCENGTPETNNTVELVAAAANYQGIRFAMGVPFELNHANPLLAAPPLNDGSMHWHWRSGYKFLRASVGEGESATWIHLGSTGCEGTVGNISACNSPNRVRVALDSFDTATDVIAVELTGLLNREQMLQHSERTDCSSGPAETACKPAFQSLGLRFGDQEADSEQTVFGVFR